MFFRLWSFFESLQLLFQQHYYYGLALLHKYMSTRASEVFTNQRDTITCDTICVVDGLSLPHWTFSFLSTNYCLTRFTCILFLLLEYICFSINPFCVPRVFFLSASQQLLSFHSLWVFHTTDTWVTASPAVLQDSSQYSSWS